MQSGLSQYGAVTTKVRALWGMRLLAEDYRHMLEMRTVSDVAVYLRAHPVWSGAFNGANINGIHRSELEELLRRHKISEYLRLFPYLSQEDRKLASFPIMREELTQIMSYLRHARAGRADLYSYSPPPEFDRASKINYQALSSASTYENLLDAVKGTVFAPTLARLKPSGGGFPDFTVIDAALQSNYLRSLQALILKRKQSAVRDKLLEIIGMQGDLFNISVISRIKRYYPELQGQFLNYLVPVYNVLNPELLKQLYTAENSDAIIPMLKNTRYGKFFSKPCEYPEQNTSRVIYEFGLRGIHENMPSVITVLSYIYLSDNEMTNLIHVIECVRYNVPAGRAIKFIVE